MLVSTNQCTKIDKKTLKKFIESLDIRVNTNTKARGHQGFFFKNRIDVSKHLNDERSVEVMVHEFAHYIHSKIESDIYKTGGSLEQIFCLDDCLLLEKELYRVTDLIDRNSRLVTLKRIKGEITSKIKDYHSLIQLDYPDFQRSKKFREFDKYIKRSNARYLLKYDRVKIVSPFLRHETLISIDKLDSDFYDMPRAFSAYIKLKSYQRKQARVSRRINKFNKYYRRPSELFARFVEGYFFRRTEVFQVAPITTNRFEFLLNQGHFFELEDLLNL